MTLLIGVYLTALAVSAGFFIWAAFAFIRGRRATRPASTLNMGPDSEPWLVALYCQYLVAPQKALEEAQQAVALVAGRRAPATATVDFFELIDVLRSKLPASSSR